MNCKPGDMAMIVNALCKENLGKIVTCVRYIGKCDFSTAYNDLWVIEEPITWIRPYTQERYQVALVGDKSLRPIRGGLTKEQMEEELKELEPIT